jgi:hypothetical protein
MTIGPDTYVHDLLAVCGAANVFGESTARYPTVTLDGKLFSWHGPRVGEALRTLPGFFGGERG